MRPNVERIKKLGTGLGSLLWPGVAGIVTITLALFSVTDIEPGQVAVRINNLSGAQEVITQPGWATRVPGLHSVHVLDASPQTFTMASEQDQDELNVRALTVRASDGSNFHFRDTTIIFQLAGDEAIRAVWDSGAGDGFLTWMRPFARSILRDEFGRESTINVSNPTTYGEAAARAQQRLNDFLGPHGILVTQLVTPRPQFNDAYEKAIEERNALGNQLQVIQSDLERAATDRQRKLAEVDQEQNSIIQQKRASLESDLAEAIADQAKVKSEADTYRIAKVAEGQAALSAAKHRARELEGELAAKYEGKKAEIEAFRSQPVERVMQRLGEKLKSVTIDIQPYADDPTPSRVKYQEIKP